MNRLLLLIALLLCIVSGGETQDNVYRTTFAGDAFFLRVELLDDDLAHFELTTTETDTPISSSVMVAKTDYAGASTVTFPAENEIATAEMHLQIDPLTLCVTVTDLIREVLLTTICPSGGGLTFAQAGTTDLYGLGQHFRRRGGTDGNWIGERILPGGIYGNTMTNYNGGMTGNTQFPILYALGEAKTNYALFVDHPYQQAWFFHEDPFTMRTRELPLRWYVMTGDDLPDLRADYMELTGKPPVPPKQMFGLWVSEYGYENWDELLGVLDSMRAANFPLDGFVLDLQWFGGVERDQSQMGSLTWDEANFPDPAGFIARLRDEYGLGLMVIEESYVSETAPGYDEAVEAGVLVTECAVDCPPVRLNAWWGSGGMVDWTNPEAAAWWHDNRRQHLIDAGVIGFWTDLGEPEDFDPSAYYFGGEHPAIHNLYNLRWSESIRDGYQRNNPTLRPFIMSRSGTSGSQRFGVAMWSGDIAANMMSLSEQQNVQMHMALSGVDYFGSDVGGFHRTAFDPVLGMEGIYTVWLANSALTDVPLRPHAMNLSHNYHTAPSLIGDVPANLANVRLRYALSPYLYTLAHQAYRTGEAIFPPLVYYFQDDPNVRTLGGQKMIGSHLMMTTLSDYSPKTTEVYLPAGGWFNYRTGELIQSEGEIITIEDDTIQAPLFVRDGAIIPVMSVDDDHAIIFNVYNHSTENGAFTLIEDDGVTMAYQDGAVRETTISHQADGDSLTVTIDAASGTYIDAPDSRSVEVHLFSPTRVIGSVLLNGESVEWSETAPGQFVVKLGEQPVDTPLTLTFAPAETAMQPEQPLFLAHYMPWYQTPDVSGYWGWHWTMNHFNPPDQFASHYTPLTGLYDSSDDALLEYQVLLMKLSGIDGVIVDWYGTAAYNDYPALNAATGKLFEYITRAGLRFVICYEDRTIQTMIDGGRLTTATALEQGQADMQYAREQWFNSESYVSYQGQPLVFVFGPLYFRQFSDWETIFAGFDPSPALVTLDNNLAFGSLTNYPWAPMHLSGGIELPQASLDSYLERFYRNAQRRDFIVGSAFPAFHDIYAEAGVRSSYGSINARDGETLRYTLDLALT